MTHPQFDPFTEQSLLVELTQQATLGDAVGAARRVPAATTHPVEEVVLAVTKDARPPE